MSMVVQHNMSAMNANRMLGVTTSAQSKSTEKLSSGFRINRAADDAAGLSISEKMRSQIRGLNQASTNAQVQKQNPHKAGNGTGGGVKKSGPYIGERTKRTDNQIKNGF